MTATNGTANGTALSRNEHKRLTALEGRIRDGLDTFIDVGIALAEIQRDRLYRGAHESFEGYCREKWGFNRCYAFRLIAAAEVAEDVYPTGIQINERQARELVPLETAEERCEILEQATDGGTRTATSAEIGRLADLAMQGLDTDARRQVIEGDEHQSRGKSREERLKAVRKSFQKLDDELDDLRCLKSLRLLREAVASLPSK